MASEMMQYLARIGIDDSLFNPTLEGMANKLLAFTTSATAGFAAVGIAAGLVIQKFQEMAANADHMQDLSAAIGVSVQELQKFQYAAQLSGEDITAYDSILVKLTMSMGKAKDATSEQAQAFARLGVNPEGKSTAQVFEATFLALQKVDDAAVRADMSMTLLGKSWVEATKLGNDYLQNVDEINSATYISEAQTKRLAAEHDKLNGMIAKGAQNAEVFLANWMMINDSFREAIPLIGGLTGAVEGWAGTDLSKSGAGFKQGIDRAPSGVDATLAAEGALFAQVDSENKKAAAQELSALNASYNSGKMTLAQYNAARAGIANGYVTGGASLLSAGPGGSVALGGSTGGAGFDQGGQAGYGGGYGFSAMSGRATEYQRSQVDTAAIDAWLADTQNLALIDDRDIVAQSMRESMINAQALTKSKTAAAVDRSNITIINYNSGNASPAEIANATAESVDRLLAGG